MVKVRYKRSFWGYDPDSVDSVVKKLDQNYKNRLIQLKKKLADEVHQLELLKTEMDRLRNETATYKTIENEIYRELLNAHLAAAEKAYLAMQSSDRADKEAAERVMHKRSKLARIKSTMDELQKEINSVVVQYMTVLDKAEGE